jgi:hypothetical protein
MDRAELRIETIRRECGFDDETCLRVEQAIARDPGWSDPAALDALPPCPVEPVPWGDVSAEGERWSRKQARRHYDYSGFRDFYSDHAAKWVLYAEWHFRRAYATYFGERCVEQCRSSPGYCISGYLAESILQWKGVAGHSDYSSSSDCEYFHYLYEHPEHWDLLLAHAPTGKSGDGWEQTFPHEKDRIARLRAMGWHETFRMNDSVFTLDPVMWRDPVLSKAEGE